MRPSTEPLCGGHGSPRWTAIQALPSLLIVGSQGLVHGGWKSHKGMSLDGAHQRPLARAAGEAGSPPTRVHAGQDSGAVPPPPPLHSLPAQGLCAWLLTEEA